MERLLLVSFVLFAPIQIVVLTAILCHTLLQLNCWVIKTNCIRSRFSATRVHFLIVLVLLICVTIGALEQILTAHFKTYDGQLWKDFQHQNGQACLAAHYSYAVVDWFQPYKLTQSSVGAIYLTVMNLPYQERFKRENVILLGIIPGPGEPRRNINQYLRPFVKEMLQYNTGVMMDVYGQKDKQSILFGVACDLPAGRKSCGLLGHSAAHGCSRCLKTFPGSAWIILFLSKQLEIEN